jgi:hypothetical protein
MSTGTALHSLAPCPIFLIEKEVYQILMQQEVLGRTKRQLLLQNKLYIEDASEGKVNILRGHSKQKWVYVRVLF